MLHTTTFETLFAELKDSSIPANPNWSVDATWSKSVFILYGIDKVPEIKVMWALRRLIQYHWALSSYEQVEQRIGMRRWNDLSLRPLTEHWFDEGGEHVLRVVAP